MKSYQIVGKKVLIFQEVLFGDSTANLLNIILFHWLKRKILICFLKRLIDFHFLRLAFIEIKKACNSTANLPHVQISRHGNYYEASNFRTVMRKTVSSEITNGMII